MWKPLQMKKLYSVYGGQSGRGHMLATASRKTFCFSFSFLSTSSLKPVSVFPYLIGLCKVESWNCWRQAGFLSLVKASAHGRNILRERRWRGHLWTWESKKRLLGRAWKLAKFLRRGHPSSTFRCLGERQLLPEDSWPWAVGLWGCKVPRVPTGTEASEKDFKGPCRLKRVGYQRGPRYSGSVRDHGGYRKGPE